MSFLVILIINYKITSSYNDILVIKQFKNQKSAKAKNY